MIHCLFTADSWDTLTALYTSSYTLWLSTHLLYWNRGWSLDFVVSSPQYRLHPLWCHQLSSAEILQNLVSLGIFENNFLKYPPFYGAVITKSPAYAPQPQLSWDQKGTCWVFLKLCLLYQLSQDVAQLLLAQFHQMALEYFQLLLMCFPLRCFSCGRAQRNWMTGSGTCYTLSERITLDMEPHQTHWSQTLSSHTTAPSSGVQ